MFKIDGNNTIHITRGDIMSIDIAIKDDEDNDYVFQEGDTIRFSVYEKNNYKNIKMRKTIEPAVGEDYVTMNFSAEDTTIGDIINKPKDYWYEIELNAETSPQTILGHDENGAKILRLYPEGDEE